MKPPALQSGTIPVEQKITKGNDWEPVTEWSLNTIQAAGRTTFGFVNNAISLSETK